MAVNFADQQPSVAVNDHWRPSADHFFAAIVDVVPSTFLGHIHEAAVVSGFSLETQRAGVVALDVDQIGFAVFAQSHFLPLLVPCHLFVKVFQNR